MKKVTVIGKFCFAEEAADGQSIKTRIVTKELEKALGAGNIHCIDTFGWKKNPAKLFASCVKAVHNSNAVIFMTDAGGIKVFPWLLSCANVFSNCKLHYVVVGAWLTQYVKKQKIISAFLKRFDGIFVETNALKNGLENLGYRNVYIMPNFKPLIPLDEASVHRHNCEPYKFCTFSRVMKEKGIEEAVNAIQYVNSYFGRNVCELDIYGQVDPRQTAWFEEFSSSFPETVRYCGIVPYDQSVSVLREYHALLFPTKFYDEGNPGTIIDAYAAGIPVIASEWENVDDIVDRDLTGVVYPFGSPEALNDVVLEFVKNPEIVFGMKTNCLNKAEQYLPDAVMDILLSKLF